MDMGRYGEKADPPYLRVVIEYSADGPARAAAREQVQLAFANMGLAAAWEERHTPGEQDVVVSVGEHPVDADAAQIEEMFRLAMSRLSVAVTK